MPVTIQSARDDGAQALELAAVLPAILLLALLLVAVGQICLAVLATDHLAHRAVRLAAIAHDDAVQALLADAELTAVTVDPPSGTRRPGDPVTVTLTRRVPVLLLGGGVQLTAHATQRTEDVP